MKPFLKKVAEFLHSTYGSQIAEVQVILPNKRAGLYLGKYLGELYGKPIWSPEFLSIEEFVSKFSGLQPISYTELLFELYQVHVEIEKSKAQDFEQFLGWAQLVLKDFNDIDAYLVDAVTTFRYLSDAKRLSKWELDREQQTDLEIQYLRFYANLEHYYVQLRKRLLDKNLAYNGMASGYLAENIADKISKNAKLVFVGFNAITPAEKKIIHYCTENLNAKVLWDIDSYYFEDESQEAGLFLRNELADVDPKKIQWIEDNLNQSKKEIHLYSVAGNVLQTKVVNSILTQIRPDLKNSPDECAVVLADETLLLPMLGSLPNDLDDFNLTMSYPLVMSQAFEFTQLCIDSLIYSKQGSSTNSEQLHYFKFVEKILQHPFISQAINSGNIPNLSEILLSNIRKYNKVYIKFSSFLNFSETKENEFCTYIFTQLSILNSQPKDFLKIMSELLNFLQKKFYVNQPVHLGFMLEMNNLLTQLSDLIEKFQLVYNLRSLKKLLKITAQNHGIPFSGEPLSGIQLMGMLETRLLDFRNIILVSANDGVLPKSQPYQSFIFYDIKRELKLPLPHENDAIFAYHFYRLLQRAENIHILYNQVEGNMGGGEPSQFIRQLQLEIEKVNPNIEIIEHQVNLPLSASNQSIGKEEIQCVQKDEFVQSKLKEIAEKGFSPSSINQFQKCSMQFYFSRILGLSEIESVEETLEANTFGTVIHNCLDKLYRPFVGKVLKKENVEEMKSIFSTILNQEYVEYFKEGDLSSGKNHLSYQISKRFIERFLENEIARITESQSDIKIFELEKEFKRSLEIRVNNENINVNFKGNADRIDEIGNQKIVWDYKTGGFKEYVNHPAKPTKELDFKQVLANNLRLPKFDKSLQVLMYVWLAQESFNSNVDFSTGIIALRNNNPYNLIEIEDSEVISTEIISIFEQSLKEVVSEIFDSSLPFTLTEEINICQNCDYKSLCNR